MPRRWADEFRRLNRAPWVVGLTALISGGLGIIALGLSEWSWLLALPFLLSLALGVLLMAFYYGLRQED